uniref:Kelch repeat protein n=1 Tax=Trichuris muris TaxID=70415 RepID=A0A5S6QMJ0_TRIMR
MSAAFVCRSPAVEQFCCCSCGSLLYLFGGAKFDGTFVNELCQFSLERHWIILPAGGSVPRPRVEASITYANSKLFLFGGLGSDGTLLNDLYAYDLGRTTWDILLHLNGCVPSPRRLCGFAASNEALFLYGGDVGSSSTSIVSPHFRSVPSSSREFFSFIFEAASWKQVDCVDEFGPPPLRACTLVWTYNRCVLFGGENNCGISAASTFVYNPEERKWTASSINTISSRCNVSAVPYMDRFIIAYGGKDVDDFELDDLLIYDLSADTWSTSNTKECELFIAEVGCRYSHGSAILIDNNGIPQTQLTDSYIVSAG